MKGFRGRETVRLDESGRLKIPAKFLEIMKDNWGEEVYITSLTGRYVWLFPIPVWEKTEERLLQDSPFNPKSSKFLDRVGYWGKSDQIDKKGRILIPPYLRKSAVMDGELIILGKIDHLVVWNKELFEKDVLSEPFDENAFWEIIGRR
ncbi:MAG: division/cell wall cluster transcriptional repressor MraZ [Candidatus Aminicenantia bacterium]